MYCSAMEAYKTKRRNSLQTKQICDGEHISVTGHKGEESRADVEAVFPCICAGTEGDSF